MKNWFKKLEDKKKKIVVWTTWIIFIISFLLFGLVPEEEHDLTFWEGILTIVFLSSFIFGIIFSVWKVKFKNVNQEKNENVSNYTPIIEKSISTIRTENENSKKESCLINNYVINANLTFIDVETPNRSNDRICSIALINKVNGTIKFKQNLYINPETRFDEINMQIHGITPKMVENAAKFNEVWDIISKYFLNSIIVGHGVKSDLAIISKTLQHYGLKLNTVCFIDTYSLSKKYIIAKSYKLSELTKDYNCERQSHDALSDCIDCEYLLNKIILDNNIDVYSEIEEYYIQHQEIQQPKAYGQIKNTKETKAYQKLQQTVSKIIEDNNVSIEELQQFINEVESNDLKNVYPINKAYECAIQKLNNADIDINKSFTTITGNIACDVFDGVFDGKLFCLTGDFTHGAKNEIADYIISQGGLVKDSLTLKVDYLVRGLQGSDAYAYGSYGSKVKKALEMKEKGNSIKIIMEDDIY